MTLKDEDIVTKRSTSRRSFFLQIGGGLIGATAVATVLGAATSDTDSGRPADSKVRDSDNKNRVDYDKRQQGDAKTPAPSKDTDSGRPADSKVRDSDNRNRVDYDKRTSGDPKS